MADFTQNAPFGTSYSTANLSGDASFAKIGRNDQYPYQFSESISSDLTTFNNAGGTWLPIFEAQVQAAYDQFRVFEPMVTSATIESGKAKVFPMTGTVGFKPVWGAGDELFGGVTDSSGTFMITLDDRPMAAHFELDSIDLLVTQWEFRTEYARQCAQRLANTRDGQILAQLVRAAALDARTNDPRGASTADFKLTGGWLYDSSNNSALQYLGKTSLYSNQTVVTTNSTENGLTAYSVTRDQRMQGAQALLDAISYILIRMREKNLPTEGFYCAVSPQAFDDLLDLGVPSVSYVPPLAAAIAAGNTNTAQAGPQYASMGPLFGVSPTGAVNVNQRLIWKGVTIIQTNRFADFDGFYAGASAAGETKVNGIDMPVKSSGLDLTASTTVNYDTHAGPIHYGQRDKYGYALGFFRKCSTAGPNTYNQTHIYSPAGTLTVNTNCGGADIRAVMWHPSAVCAIRKLGLSSTTVKDVRRNTFFTCFSMYSGTDVMKPELAAVISGAPLASKANLRTCLGGTTNFPNLIA